MQTKEKLGKIKKVSANTRYRGAFVDGETEFFDGRKWKKMRDYKPGDLALTYIPGSPTQLLPATLITTGAPIDLMQYRSLTLDMVFSDTFRIPYYPEGKNTELTEKNGEEIREKWERDSNGFRGRAPLTFETPALCRFDEAMLRVVAMVNADGSYCKTRTTLDGTGKKKRGTLPHNVYSLRVFKERKIERARQLLKAANIEFLEQEIKGQRLPGVNFLFRLNLGFDPKHFPEEWIYLPVESKKALLDEIMYWDGHRKTTTTIPKRRGGVSTGTRQNFSCSKKEDADLIQFIAHSCGMSARMRKDERCHGNAKVNYMVNLRCHAWTKLTKYDPSPAVRHSGEFNTVKDYGYSLTAGKGYVILRRDNKIFMGCMAEQEKKNAKKKTAGKNAAGKKAA